MSERTVDALALVPLDDSRPEPVAPLRCWPEPPVALLPRTPLPEVDEVGWDEWDSAVRWHDSKLADL